MRSMVADETKVGLLLFDEPSAALDPVAEHGECTSCLSIFEVPSDRLVPDLFNRLQELRGTKTMIFSSHRFGKLMRNADLIM